MPRNNVLLQRLPNRRRVQLSNGQVFFAKYKRVNRHTLAVTQVGIVTSYVQKIGPKESKNQTGWSENKRKRRQQAGAALNIDKTVDPGKREASSKLGKMMINDAIDYIPTAYKN